MCYIDPLFPLSFLIDSWLPGALDALFQASFLCALLLFWLCVYHGLRQNDRRWLIFYFPKVVLVGSIWLSMIVVAMWQEYEEVSDPTFSYQLDTEHFYVRTILISWFMSSNDCIFLSSGIQNLLLCGLCIICCLSFGTDDESVQWTASHALFW